MSERLRRTALYFAAILLSASFLSACSGISVSGGLIGSMLSLFGIVLLVFTVTTTQTGCPVQPCLSPLPPEQVEDGGNTKDTIIGPCLSPPPPDVRSQPDSGQPDSTVQPCLQPPPPDVQPDSGQPDSTVQPCLSAPPDKMGSLTPNPGMEVPQMQGPKFASQDEERKSAIKRLQQRGALPADVAARLQKKDKKA